MYSKPFYLTKPFGNNAFSYNKRINKELYVTNLIKINSFDDIKLGDKVVFEDFDFNGKLISCMGLENFYDIDININKIQGIFQTSLELQKKKIYLVDNHNHVYFFWHKSRLDGLIGNNCTLYHIDEHTDMRDPGIYLEKDDLSDIKKIFEYTNYVDVGNYIIPAIHDGLVKEIYSIRSESELNESLLVIASNEAIQKTRQNQIILNLDLDFFQPKLDYIDYNLKKEVIQKLIKKASVITIATSPFFINQKLALNIFRDLFSTI